MYFYNTYPTIFKTQMNTEGFRCGDGWYNIINELVWEINYLSNNFDITVVFDCVKEKFGTLRIYHHLERGDDEQFETSAEGKIFNGIIDKLILFASNNSAHICELCGTTVKAKQVTLSNHIIKTLCEKCAFIESL